MKALQLSQINVGAPVLYGMPTIPMLEQVAQREIFSLLDEMGFVDGEDYVFRKRSRDLVVQWEEGEGLIMFRSTENPRRLVGMNLAAVVLDEAEDNKEDSVSILKTRIRHPRAKVRQFVALGTPESMGGWFYAHAEGDLKDETTNVVRARTRDNYFLGADYERTAFAHLTDAERELYTEGRFVARRGRVYTQFDAARHSAPYRGEAGDWVMGCDFGRGVMAWVFGVVVDDRLHIIGEQVLEGSDTIIASHKARAWWRDFFEREQDLDVTEQGAAEMVTAYVDPAGEMKGSISDVRVMREQGFRVLHHHQHPRIKDRVLSVQQKLSRTELVVDGERAPYLVRCLQGQTYDKYGLPEKGRPRDGMKAHDHANDALGYLVCYRWPASLRGGLIVH